VSQVITSMTLGWLASVAPGLMHTAHSGRLHRRRHRPVTDALASVVRQLRHVRSQTVTLSQAMAVAVVASRSRVKGDAAVVVPGPSKVGATADDLGQLDTR
jgi:hypothetical protein